MPSEERDSRSRQNRGQMGPTPLLPIQVGIAVIVAILIYGELQSIIGGWPAVLVSVFAVALAINIIYALKRRRPWGEADGE